MFATFPGRRFVLIIHESNADVRFKDLFTNTYGFSIGVSGLCYIGLGLGFFLATIFGASFADRVYLNVRNTNKNLSVPPSDAMSYLQLSNRNGGKGKPEFRIPALIFGSLFVPIGLL